MNIFGLGTAVSEAAKYAQKHVIINDELIGTPFYKPLYNSKGVIGNYLRHQNVSVKFYNMSAQDRLYIEVSKINKAPNACIVNINDLLENLFKQYKFEGNRVKNAPLKIKEISQDDISVKDGDLLKAVFEKIHELCNELSNNTP